MSINSCTLDGIKGITQLNGISWAALNVSITKGRIEGALVLAAISGFMLRLFIYLFAGRV